MRRSLLFITLILLLTPSTSFCKEPQINSKINIEGIQFYLPPEVSFSYSSPVEDFILCSFELDGKPFMKAYIGNWPSFLKKYKTEEKATHNHEWIDGQKHNRDFLVDLKERDWPKYAHFFYYDQSENNARLAEEIIFSLGY